MAGAEVERVCLRSRKAAARCAAGAAACWALAARLQRLQPDLQRALAPASPAPYAALLNSCTHHVSTTFVFVSTGKCIYAITPSPIKR